MKTKDIDGVKYVSTAELNKCLPFVLQAMDIEAWGFVPKKIRAGSWWAVTDVLPILAHVDQLVDEFTATVQQEHL